MLREVEAWMEDLTVSVIMILEDEHSTLFVRELTTKVSKGPEQCYSQFSATRREDVSQRQLSEMLSAFTLKRLRSPRSCSCCRLVRIRECAGGGITECHGA